MNALKKILSVAILATVLTSCLKDKNVEEQRYGTEGIEGKKIIELSSDATHANTTGLAFVNRDTTLNFVAVRLAASEVASEDINVTLTTASSATLIGAYNTANGTSIVSLPNSLYTVQGANGLVVTIPKGQREGYLRLRVNPSTFDPSTTYAIGYSIASVDKPGYTISQNFKTFIAIVGAKNDYDGRYAVTGSCVDANGLYKGVYPTEVDLITVSGNQVLYYQHEIDYMNYVVEAIAGGALANTGIRPKITFDPNTDKVTSIVRNSDNAAMTVGSISKFNRADRSLDIVWTLGRWSVTEHYTYIGPR